MITSFGAAWTPDLPDGGLADSDTLAQVAAAEYDPAQDDHFDGITLCGAKLDFWRRDDRAYAQLVCGEDDGHYPETAHQALVTWQDKPGDELPAEPGCQDCADTGVTAGGTACQCPAGKPFQDAQTNRADYA